MSLRDYPPSDDQPWHNRGRVSMVYCPRNFAGTMLGSAHPDHNTAYHVKLRKNIDGDCPFFLLNEWGCALVDNGVFCGWVREYDTNILKWRLEQNHCVIARLVRPQEAWEAGGDFWWRVGGGVCFSGRIRWRDLQEMPGYSANDNDQVVLTEDGDEDEDEDEDDGDGDGEDIEELNEEEEEDN